MYALTSHTTQMKICWLKCELGCKSDVYSHVYVLYQVYTCFFLLKKWGCNCIHAPSYLAPVSTNAYKVVSLRPCCSIADHYSLDHPLIKTKKGENS